MIEKENKRNANRGEFLQGGEPPLIGRARSSQKTSPFYDLFFVGVEFISQAHSPCIYFLQSLMFFLSLTSPCIFFLCNHLYLLFQAYYPCIFFNH